jgi:hypothetical protein
MAGATGLRYNFSRPSNIVMPTFNNTNNYYEPTNNNYYQESPLFVRSGMTTVSSVNTTGLFIKLHPIIFIHKK